MQVLCRPSATTFDIRCPLCDQGFQLYWERTSDRDQEEFRLAIEQVLKDHHSLRPTPSTHPEKAFNVPSWSGHPHFSAAALLGGLPDR